GEAGARARRAEAAHPAAPPLLRPPVREDLDSMLGFREPGAQRTYQRFERLTVLTQVAEELTQLDLDRLTRDQGGSRGSPGACSRSAKAQLAEGLARLDRAQEDGPMLGGSGHDGHSASAKEIDAIGHVVRFPYVGALRIPSNASQRSVVRQVAHRDAGQRLAVEMMRKLRCLHGAILEASCLRRSAAVRASPLVVSQSSESR